MQIELYIGLCLVLGVLIAISRQRKQSALVFNDRNLPEIFSNEHLAELLNTLVEMIEEALPSKRVPPKVSEAVQETNATSEKSDATSDESPDEQFPYRLTTKNMLITYLSSEHTRKHIGQTLSGQYTHLLTITQVLSNATNSERESADNDSQALLMDSNETCHLLVLFITEGLGLPAPHSWTRSEDKLLHIVYLLNDDEQHKFVTSPLYRLPDHPSGVTGRDIIKRAWGRAEFADLTPENQLAQMERSEKSTAESTVSDSLETSEAEL